MHWDHWTMPHHLGHVLEHQLMMPRRRVALPVLHSMAHHREDALVHHLRTHLHAVPLRHAPHAPPGVELLGMRTITTWPWRMGSKSVAVPDRHCGLLNHVLDPQFLQTFHGRLHGHHGLLHGMLRSARQPRLGLARGTHRPPGLLRCGARLP